MKIEVHRHPGTPDGKALVVLTDPGWETREHPVLPPLLIVEPDAAARVVAREVFNGLTLITDDDETLVITMRDSGFECAYQYGDRITSFSLQLGQVSKL